MADEKPQSLSDVDRSDKKKFITITDTMDLPSNRKEIVGTFKRILELGMVQKVVVELGRPIQFSRLIPEDLIMPEQKPMEEDPLDAVRAGTILELKVQENDSLRTISPAGRILFKAFEIMTENHYQAKYFVVGNYVELRKWLGLSNTYSLTHLFGVETKHSKDMPSDAIILAGVNLADPERIAFSIKINLDEV